LWHGGVTHEGFGILWWVMVEADKVVVCCVGGLVSFMDVLTRRGRLSEK